MLSPNFMNIYVNEEVVKALKARYASQLSFLRFKIYDTTWSE